MPKDTLALVLNGDIPLAAFAEAMEHFNALVELLSDEVAGADEIEWEIARLEGGSATTVARGICPKIEPVERVIEAYNSVGRALKNRSPIPYSEDVEARAKSLLSFLNGKVTSVGFVTDGYEAFINEAIIEEEAEGLYSLGTVTGVIETVSSRRGLKFTLYDSLFDKAVYCYFNEEQREKIREVWGKRVSVAGRIVRDPYSGRPIRVFNVRRIEVLEDVPPDSYERARGVLPWKEGDEPSEVIIRRSRDAT